MRISTTLAAAAASVLLLADVSLAQSDYPTRPVRLIVPYAAGGITDVATRMIARELERELGQSVIVDNRPGAATSVASNYMLNQKPDGYTLYAASLSLPLNQFLQPDVTYDAFK